MNAGSLTIGQTVDEIKNSLHEYIEATYHISHPSLIRQRKRLLDAVGNTYQPPFLESTPRYKTGKYFAELDIDLTVRNFLVSLTAKGSGQAPLLFDPPYTHQAQALEAVLRDGRSLVVTTGTGSGKTESFLLPMLGKLASEAANRRDSFQAKAVRALILYPMNALVNDQLGRLRLLLGDDRITQQFGEWAGRPVRFARYTSRTPYPGLRDVDKDKERLKSIGKYYVELLDDAEDSSSPDQQRAKALISELQKRGKWPAKPDIRAWYGRSGAHWQDRTTGEFRRAVTLTDDVELITRHEVLEAPPDVLITNYSMLEYMLMRPLERPIFDATQAWLETNPEENFLLVVDEAHLYRGAAGAEVSLLLRRLRARLGIPAERLQVIATSASFSDTQYACSFAAQLSGKNETDFDPVTGEYDFRDPAAPGNAEDAAVLVQVPMGDYYDAEDDSRRLDAIKGFLSYRGISPTEGTPASQALYDALNEFPPLGLLVNETMRKALPIGSLGQLVFPGVDDETANMAVSTLISLGSAARTQTDQAGLLPCRMHGFFRGLPGLWACLDPDCTVDRGGIPPGPIGAMYGQPRSECDCGARVYELYTCRQCGTAYARAFTDNLADPSFLWNVGGETFNAASGMVEKLDALDLLLEEPSRSDVQLRELDLVTGRLKVGGERARIVWLRFPRTSDQLPSGGGGDDTPPANLNGEFIPCGVCEQTDTFGRSYVQDHQTKGDEPFQALVNRQLEVQPPGPDAADDFAPLRGRKVLTFSDSRNVAARLALNLQDFSTRDVIRPLVLKGWTELARQETFAPVLSLDYLYLAAMIGAKVLGVRLRPELTGNENFDAYRYVSEAIDNKALEDQVQFNQLLAIRDGPPQSLLRALVATLTHPYFGFAALGLASIKERENLRDELVSLLPDLDGVAANPEEKLALVRMWLQQWISPGIWFSAMAGDWDGTEVQAASGKFIKIYRWMNSPPAKRVFEKRWLPILLAKFCRSSGNSYQLDARNVALQINGSWGYCNKCRFTQRPFPGSNKCVSCGKDEVRVLDDPNTDEVFQARKGYYRSSSVRATATPPGEVMSIVAAEHTAQLNSSAGQDVFSKAEMYELLFQDVNIGKPAQGHQPDVAVDVLSCTTTMEVGIDIGKLTGVALRNMPPSRANYQQRAGRAGRRGNAVATVISFGSGDTHDEHYFREPAEMISGDVVDPKLTLDNIQIVRRHVTAYLLQRYHQERVQTADPNLPPNLFDVLGTVSGFLDPASRLNRSDFASWLESTKVDLRKDVADWLPVELEQRARETILDGIVSETMDSIDYALDLKIQSVQETDSEDVAAELDETRDEDAEIVDPDESPEEQLSAQRALHRLLDRLLYKGVLPRYAFPTDVVSFYIFDPERSTFRRPAFRYEPSQGLTVALTQYAPGRNVPVDRKRWTSGALFALVREELTQAYRDKMLYFECRECRYATHYDPVETDRVPDYCPACKGDKWGPGMSWMRPTGFAHRVFEAATTTADDSPSRSYATRAKLMAAGPGDERLWIRINDRLQSNIGRRMLLVSNTGPKEEGYTYCTFCGLISPTAVPSPLFSGTTHPRPYPSPRRPMCEGGYVKHGLVLGTDFESDVLLLRLTVCDPVTLRFSYLSTQIALRSVSEAFTLASARTLGIDASEIEAEFRPALSRGGGFGTEAEIYVYDKLAGGAGFTRQVSEQAAVILRLALEILEECPVPCDSSCYRCLRSFRNRFYHSQLDRFAGASLLRYLLDGEDPKIDAERMKRSTTKLYDDLLRSDVDGVQFLRDEQISIPEIGDVVAPILAVKGSKRLIVAVHSPLTPDWAPSEELRKVDQQTFERVRLIDELKISRSLPKATLDVLEVLR